MSKKEDGWMERRKNENEGVDEAEAWPRMAHVEA
jgi:hypothetical protein